ncbi:hypothetical protein NDU88_007474 [Pleurodeles waltl]|uniref:Uncharacterized protein n=1 Tax=Pleurodeles waltl TaxID=8319 RepID=A0AAV7LVH6_PLEWA|nr:hypothetical protein NDU88_007474 [Pleurodeles waltl]
MGRWTHEDRGLCRGGPAPRTPRLRRHHTDIRILHRESALCCQAHKPRPEASLRRGREAPRAQLALETSRTNSGLLQR